VALLLTLLVVWRSAGFFNPPVDAVAGGESTHGAFINVVAGRVAGAFDAPTLLPPSAPWHGPAPVDPASSLPLYDWFVAALWSLLGPQAWIGRAVSIVLSLIAGMFLFLTVRRVAGARAALYALLLYSVAPLSVLLGQQFGPSALILSAQASVLLTVVRWKMVSFGNRAAAVPAFAVAVLSCAFLGLVDPAAIFVGIPVAYIAIAPAHPAADLTPLSGRSAGMRDAWRNSPLTGQAIVMVAAMLLASTLWWVFTQGSESGLALGVGDGGGGIPTVLGALFNAGTYVQMVGMLVERVLTLAGLLLLGAGLLHAARPPLQMIFHTWLLSAAVHIILDASRLPSHDDVLLPIILPACALAGIGAAWAGALPARLWLAIREQKHDREADYAVSPHTSWLFDLPEERNYIEKSVRPQAELALSKSIAQRTRSEAQRLRRGWLLAAGHLLVVAVLGLIMVGGAPAVWARLQPTPEASELSAIGAEVRDAIPADAPMIVAGPYAPELFFSSQRTGWSLPEDKFSIEKVHALQADGAGYLLSADQAWLGRNPDYRGLITTYSVFKLARGYILFDLNTKPSDSDRLYFLESGHTLGGAFRSFWEHNGGVAKLGYPISEELLEANPLDGELRTVQYFERAVLEYHKEKEGTPGAVMLASVGRWVTAGRDFKPVDPVANTPDRWYFAETGHIVKQAFLKYWQQEGGLAMFGYPISEELPEINPGDGKVYTVQYFERARFEWHPTFSGTPDEVQLGLIGKQALDIPRK
jgi:hypothetical protein